MPELSTKEKLLKIGKEEFLEKGYKDASLREIAKKAGFTLGAFYGYYPNKEALFNEIVQEPARVLFEHYEHTHHHFDALPEKQKIAEMGRVSGEGLKKMVKHIYENFDVFRLVFFCAVGTQYEHYLQRFIDLENASTYRFLETLRSQGYAVELDDDLIHILTSGMFYGFTEIVDHNMEREKAERYVEQLRIFYTAGWYELMGL
ncbi:TetR/AcrR family transcriptional regulator [Oscillospiraceae bacterium MB08-C2-2]|nr:TetR/AcrR family transcriptional regulator [Oscillospiraceae bacterium MB08-C2-2]